MHAKGKQDPPESEALDTPCIPPYINAQSAFRAEVLASCSVFCCLLKQRCESLLYRTYTENTILCVGPVGPVE